MAGIDFDSEKIDKYFAGVYSDTDSSYVDEVFCESDKEKELEHHLRRQWYEILDENDKQDKNLDHILYKIHYEINTKIADRKNRKFSRFLNWSARIAGMIILPLAIFWGVKGYLNNNSGKETWVEIKAPAWTRAQFSLPDGTTGWLNSNSSIKYYGRFNNNRQVTLKGEAFFDVYKDSKRPFKVSADEVLVTVSGTRFNIASYDNENTVEVVLEEGEVVCFNERLNKSYSMKPNDYISFDKTLNDCKVEVVQPEKYSSWKEGKLVFRNDPLDVLARRLGRWYNIDIEILGDMSNQPRLRATFIDENLEEVLKLLELSLQITYDIEPPQIRVDESYSKTKVILRSKIK
ncbi:MAG TPA: FecR family protein [Bacteroidales bacterium]|nr:FecR family protein [Bacteroidales bacterium]